MANILILGGGITGMQCSLNLADLGHNVFLIEKEKELGGNLKNGAEKSDRINKNKNIKIFTESKLIGFEGRFPDFKATIKSPLKTETLPVNSLIIATGFEPYSLPQKNQYGYGQYPNVMTTVEFGKRAGEVPGSITLIQCVGSRDKKAQTYCSVFCCLHAIKLALMIKGKNPKAEITILYMDIRTPSTGEYFYTEARKSGIRFIRGKPAVIKNNEMGKLTVELEDTLEQDIRFIDTDLIVLSIGAVPPEENKELKDKLGVKLSDTGFISVEEEPISTNIKGIFVAGAASGPKDYELSLMQAGAAAARVNVLVKGLVKI